MNSEENEYYPLAEAMEEEQPDPLAEAMEEEQPDVKDYSILNVKDIIKLQNLDFSIVSEVLDVPNSVPCSLLRFYKWNINEACDQWFTDQNKLIESAGLYKLAKKKKKNIEIISNNKHTTCIICFEDFKPSFMVSSNACGEHYFCTTCWKNYISLSIKEGGHGSCLNLRCPEPSCKALVDLDMIDSPNLSLSNKDKEKYYRQVRRSYTEDSVKRKWCTGPGCEFVVQVDNGWMTDKYDVTCRCSNKFCWNCNEESHRPVDCKNVEAWYSITNKFSESENINWKLANTKPCPKCKRPIEKNQGCSHITCAEPCKFQFCWNCLREWFGLHVCSIGILTTTNPSNGNRETPGKLRFLTGWSFDDISAFPRSSSSLESYGF